MLLWRLWVMIVLAGGAVAIHESKYWLIILPFAIEILK